MRLVSGARSRAAAGGPSRPAYAARLAPVAAGLDFAFSASVGGWRLAAGGGDFADVVVAPVAPVELRATGQVRVAVGAWWGQFPMCYGVRCTPAAGNWVRRGRVVVEVGPGVNPVGRW